MPPLYIIKQSVQLVGSFTGPDQYTTPPGETGKVYLFLESWAKPGTYSYTILWDNYGKRTGIPEVFLAPADLVNF
ncbi:hypothetical protein GALMADRAFT_143638 [Galerina marginata CBS 339.88]|uniref:Uncharacterized protein n=1 Tax=Galerina marginata (strain CBS 339.88) TaxID=685588 RepID=A0A067SVZ9_GALM3|nr:hypothetical protein GALMADRAFT_143638 [Galerina marginata CBS 339.88]